MEMTRPDLFAAHGDNAGRAGHKSVAFSRVVN